MFANYNKIFAGDQCQRTAVCSQQLFNTSFELQVYIIEIEQFQVKPLVEARIRTFRSLTHNEGAIMTEVNQSNSSYEQLSEATPGSGMFTLELQGMITPCTLSRKHSDDVWL
jgi:hypothetical protein